MGYLDHLVHFFDLSTPVGNPDLGIPGGNPAVGANIASNPNGVGGGICAEFNGNNSNYNCGDIVELNEVPAFTIAFWMNQNVLDQDDVIFWKRVDATHAIEIYTTVAGGQMVILLNDGTGANAYFDYSTVVSVGTWAYVAMVFDGGGAANADRLKLYVDAVPVTLGYTLTIPPVTADLSGQNAYIGFTTIAFDGKLDTFMFFDQPLTSLMVTDLWNRTRRGVL